jgi:hypothetical protein
MKILDRYIAWSILAATFTVLEPTSTPAVKSVLMRNAS